MLCKSEIIISVTIGRANLKIKNLLQVIWWHRSQQPAVKLSRIAAITQWTVWTDWATTSDQHVAFFTQQVSGDQLWFHFIVHIFGARWQLLGHCFKLLQQALHRRVVFYQYYCTFNCIFRVCSAKSKKKLYRTKSQPDNAPQNLGHPAKMIFNQRPNSLSVIRLFALTFRLLGKKLLPLFELILHFQQLWLLSFEQTFLLFNQITQTSHYRFGVDRYFHELTSLIKKWI